MLKKKLKEELKELKAQELEKRNPVPVEVSEEKPKRSELRKRKK